MREEIHTSITSRGQATIPVEVRRRLGLVEGGKVAFVLEDDGTVHIARPRFPTIASLAGFAGSLPHPRPWSEIKDTIRDERAAAATAPGTATSSSGGP